MCLKNYWSFYSFSFPDFKVSTHEVLFSLIIRVVGFHVLVNSCAVCYVLCVTRYVYCSALTFSSESYFIGTPLSLMCTKVNACMYLYIFGHSQWIRACMRSNKTLWYCCKRHGDCNCESLRHTHRCLKTKKETASEETNKLISGSRGIAGNHLPFFLISLILNQIYSYESSL